MTFTPAVMAHADEKQQNVSQQEQRAANSAKQLADIFASKNSNAQASAYARGTASSAANSAVQDWLGQFGTVKAQLNVDENFSLKGSQLDVLYPLQDTPDLLTFNQLGIRHIDDRVTLNVGFGQRHFFDQYRLGYNLFFDRDLQGGHNRLGVGGEYARDNLKLAAKSYWALSGWKDSRDFADYQEKPANGFDLRAEAYHPDLPQLGGG